LHLHEEQWRLGWNAVLGCALSGPADLIDKAADRWPVYLFSNTNATHHRHWRAQHRDLLAPMREIFVTNELGLRKPELQAFASVATRIGVDAQRIFFFDDREDNVDGARAAGLQAFQVNSPAEVATVLEIELSTSSGH
jgi:FMN phosphatase YigB (HAD superfamily)